MTDEAKLKQWITDRKAIAWSQRLARSGDRTSHAYGFAEGRYSAFEAVLQFLDTPTRVSREDFRKNPDKYILAAEEIGAIEIVDGAGRVVMILSSPLAIDECEEEPVATEAVPKDRYKVRGVIVEAVILAAESCERCMNSLAHRHGLEWGYRQGSPKWVRARTECSRCRPSVE